MSRTDKISDVLTNTVCIASLASCCLPPDLCNATKRVTLADSPRSVRREAEAAASTTDQMPMDSRPIISNISRYSTNMSREVITICPITAPALRETLVKTIYSLLSLDRNHAFACSSSLRINKASRYITRPSFP